VVDVDEVVEVVGEGLGLRGCVLGCSSAHTCRRRGALSLMYLRFAHGHCNEGFSSKACIFFCKRLLSVVRLIYPSLMENSQLDNLLCTLNFWISGQWGGGMCGGGKRKEDRSKFSSWISSVDKKISFLLKRFSNSGLLFQVISKGRNNYIRTKVFTVHNSFILCAKYLPIFWGFWGSFPLRNKFFHSKVKIRRSI
jgi:hypothetical protein